MKHLERANGYFGTSDPLTGRRIEGETRSCVHCGFMWIYNPRESFDKKMTGEYKPTTRGKCLSCYGLVCAQPHCMKLGCVPLMKQIDIMENANRSPGGILLGT